MTQQSQGENASLLGSGVVEVTTPTGNELVITRIFDAPRTTIFDAWTKPEHVARWWDPTGTPLAVCEIDLRPNGAFRWVHRAPDGGEGHSFSGVYREIAAPEKLVFSVQLFPSRPEPVGTLLFAKNGTKTTLKLTIACATNEDRDALLRMRIDVGTLKTLENLAAYLPAIR